MIINLLKAKNKERVVAFLDQKKAFDMVSFHHNQYCLHLAELAREIQIPFSLD
jgi:hypothetical protein